MAALNGSPPIEQRVPAWKRIGLKLKYAKDNGPDLTHATGHDRPAAPVSHAHDADASRDESAPKSKRRKTSHDAADDSPLPVTADVASTYVSKQPPPSDSPADLQFVGDGRQEQIPGDHSSPQPENTDTQSANGVGDAKSRPRRKSVTFAPSTKVEDGLGSSASLRKLGANSDVHEPANSLPPATIIEGEKKRRRNDSSQDQPTSPGPVASKTTNQQPIQTTPRYVTYLQLFHRDRTAWKFNKKHQKDLLNNLFDIHRLPRQHDEALLQYISGLQGVQARQRIIDDSESVLREIAQPESNQEATFNMETEAARREAYRSSLRRYLERYAQVGFQRNEYDDQQIEEMRQKAERGQRAEAILGELLGKELYPDQRPATETEVPSTSTQNADVEESAPTSASANTVGRSKPDSKRKKRKSRTQASFSSSSDSDSESESKASLKRGSVNQSKPNGSNQKHSSDDTATAAAAKKKQKQGKKIFDDDLLDQVFPKKQSYHESAPKRKSGGGSKARGFAYAHGTRADESGSEDD